MDCGNKSLQSPKSRLDHLLVCIKSQAKVLVKVAVSLYPVICFIDRVEKIRNYDYHMNASLVLDISGGSRLGFSIASSNGDAIIDCLDPASGKLSR